jgi:hypothetical protein
MNTHVVIYEQAEDSVAAPEPSTRGGGFIAAWRPRRAAVPAVAPIGRVASWRDGHWWWAAEDASMRWCARSRAPGGPC